MNHSALLAAVAAASITSLATAQLGRQTLNIDVETPNATTGNLGVAELNGEIFVTSRGNGATTTAPHTVWVFDAAGNLLRQFPQGGNTASSAWGYRDGASDGTSLIFGYESGIEVIDANGAPVNTVEAANGTQAITQPIVSLGATTTHRGIAYDPNGNGGNGSIFVGNFAADIEEIGLDGTVLHTYPADGVWSVYGLALDPTTGNLWMNSAPNAGPLAEYAVDRGANTLTATGRTIDRFVGGSAQGGLDLVEGGFDGRNCGSDLIGLDQGTPDFVTGYRLELWDGYTNEVHLLAGFDGGNFSADGVGVPLGANTLEIDIDQPLTYWAFLDVGDPARPAGPIIGFKSPWELTFPRANAPAFGPLVGGSPLSLGAAAFTALPPGASVSWQAIALDPRVPVGTCGLRLPLTSTNLTDHTNLGPSTGTVISANGTNSFNSDTTSGFFSVTAGPATAGNPITQVTFDWVASSNPAQGTMVFDVDQGGMANAFWEGNQGGCTGTYRNGSDVAAGLDYGNANNNIGVGTSCATSVAHVQGDAPNTSRTLTWYFTGGTFANGVVFEFDCDTDGGAGIAGDAMAGMVVTIVLQDGSTFTGELAASGAGLATVTI